MKVTIYAQSGDLVSSYIIRPSVITGVTVYGGGEWFSRARAVGEREGGRERGGSRQHGSACREVRGPPAVRAQLKFKITAHIL